MKTLTLRLRSAGMFSNVNEVVQQLHLAEQRGYRFAIDWSDSCYRDPQRAGDPWNYYFEDCFPGADAEGGDCPQLPGGIAVACMRDNIITPRERDGDCVPLLLPRDRHLPHGIIQRYIHLKPHVQEIVDRFVAQHFRGPTIGLHIRGPGRIDGGAPGLRSRFECTFGVPFGRYFETLERQLARRPEARVFASSDSAFVMREIVRRYGERVTSYPAIRSEFGEMHDAAHPANRGTRFPPYRLGEDVLVEACIFARTDYFIHGNSNVVNYVLCLNPALEHGSAY
ncbi:MAG TPA: hypothetical protein ENK05_10290 [Gammaproteobacteria bacterium]|nr:hypothetical protein [Gammaproteobacteria bacterium]